MILLDCLGLNLRTTIWAKVDRQIHNIERGGKITFNSLIVLPYLPFNLASRVGTEKDMVGARKGV